MSLRDEIVGSCQICQGEGKLLDASGNLVLCECLLKFRAYNRLLDGGFCDSTLDFVSAEGYKLPQIDSGKEFLSYWSENLEESSRKGLSLFLFSSDRGRGKTTLAHWLIYTAAKYFQRTENYRRDRSYGFETAQSLQANFEDLETGLWKSTFYVLDDLGAESAESPWKREAMLSILQQVFHYRRDNKLPTIITTNYPPGFISNKYQKVLDSLMEIKPDGTIGRGKIFRAVEVGGGEDLRLVDELSEWPV